MEIVTVGFEKFCEKHTGANISAAMLRLLTDLSVAPMKLGYNVTDNASNMIKAFSTFDASVAEMAINQVTYPSAPSASIS